MNTGTTVIDTSGISKINLEINIPVLQKIKKERININQLFILFACHQGAINLLDIYDNKSTDQEVLIFDYQDLLIHGYLSEGESHLYKITEAGKDLVEDIMELMKGPEAEKETNVSALCSTYLLLWPKIKLPSNTYARGSQPDIEKKMKSWLRVYKPFLLSYYHQAGSSISSLQTKIF